MSKNDGEIVIGTKVDDSGFSNDISKLGGTAAKAMAVVTAAIGAASIAIISLGSEFETANAKASTLFGDANVNMSQYSTDMLALSTKTGLAASELGNTMYDALSAGIPASDDMSEAMGFLEKNTKLAKAGFTDINTATTATAKVLNAYKMDVSETDRVHKILMQTQNAGITTVGELGSVLSQVTPTASAMSVSFEQVGAALANMTAQGTPTAQATTQLNQLLAELGKSGTKANDSMMAATQGTAHAGKSFQDLMKEGVPLNEILDLIDQSAQDNGLSMLDMFSSIESGKAALSISGQNSKQFAKNLDAMGTSADVVGEAYEKVTNTFEEKSKKAVNSLKNVGIAAYDKFKEPLTKSMDAAQKAIDGLSKDMASGKLGKSVDKIADAFGTLIQVTIDIASKAIPLLVNGFSLVVDNGELLATAIGAISTAMFLYNNYQTISAGLHYAGALASATYSVAQAVLSKNVTLATGAAALFNTTLLANPIGLVIAAVGALIAAVTILSFTTGEEISANDALMESLNDQREAYDEVSKAAKEKEQAAVDDIAVLQGQKKELDNLVDANGKVISGFEDRASFLANELAEATGLDIELVDGQIQGYGDLAGKIDKVIEKMRAEAILEANKEKYTESIKAQKTALEAMIEAEEAHEKAIKQKDEFIKIAMNNQDGDRSRAEEAYKKHVEKLGNTLSTATDDYGKYTREVTNFEQAKTDILQENYTTVNDLVDSSSSAYANSNEEKKKLLQEEVQELKIHYATLQKDRTDANAQTTDSQMLSDQNQIAEKKLALFALNSEIWANTPQYEAAYKLMSDAGASAFDANGDLVPALQSKIDLLKLETIALSPEYSNTLMEMANTGQTVFNSNGELVTAAQKKLVDTYAKLTELSPTYSTILTNMADNGEAVFDANGNLTSAAQKKLIDTFTTANTLSPTYSNILKAMAENGEMVFDQQGNLTADAKKKVEDAAKSANENAPQFVTGLSKMAEDARKKIEQENTYAAGQEFMIGAESGVFGNAYRLTGAAGGAAESALLAMKKKWEIKSPSRASKKLSKFLMEGAGLGIEENADLLLDPIEDVATNTVGTFADILSTMDPSKIDEIVANAQNAVNSNHLVFEKQAKINAEYEVGKAVLQFQNQEIKVTGTLKANIENHINIDGRETAIVLTPFVAEELGFE